MLKNLLLTTALGGLMMSSAFAQTSQPSSPSYSTPPASSSSSDPMKSDSMKSDTKSDTMKSDTKSSATTGAASSASAVTISAQKPDQLLASKVKGADVIGSDGKKIGDVSDILFDKDGKVDAFILSVGGFLGVGAKEVALAPASVQLSQDKEAWQIKVSMTKDQLAQAPNFERYKEKSTTTGSSSSSSGSGMSGSAPKNAPASNPPANPPAPRQ